jgi:hypothetical protein
MLCVLGFMLVIKLGLMIHDSCCVLYRLTNTCFISLRLWFSTFNLRNIEAQLISNFCHRLIVPLESR